MFRPMRRKDREISKQECIKILKSENRGALAVLGDDGYPYTLPIDFYYDENENKIYFHSAKTGHKIDAINKNNKVCFTVWNEGTKKEGDWAYYVTSVVVFGRARIMTDSSEILEKATAFGMKYYPTRQELDVEIKRDLGRVRIVEIEIEHMTGKTVHEK